MIVNQTQPSSIQLQGASRKKVEVTLNNCAKPRGFKVLKGDANNMDNAYMFLPWIPACPPPTINELLLFEHHNRNHFFSLSPKGHICKKKKII